MTAQYPFSSPALGILTDEGHEHRPIQTRIRIKIPQNFHREPVISRLVSHHGVTVNIIAALLGVNAAGDGWFDLELEGTPEQTRSALLYLNELDLEVWYETPEDQDGW